VPELDIKPADVHAVQAILQRYIPAREVWAFGSRVTGNVKPFSDLDLAIIGNDPVPAPILADLKDAFSESDLPFKVDIVDWAETKDNFRKIIEAAYVVVQNGY
jgi:type I restriction enzyme S subunit